LLDIQFQPGHRGEGKVVNPELATIGTAQDLLDGGQQVVIFTEFKDTGNQIAAALGGEFLSGDTPNADRDPMVQRFQAGTTRALVCTFKAGGVGITPFLAWLDSLTEAVRQGAAAPEADGAMRPQPVFCLLKTELLESLVKFTQGGGRKIDAWTVQHRCAIVPFDLPGDSPQAFANANTLAELQQLEAL
jgi:hypothetical protein